MIPADVASRMQVSADVSLRPVAPAQEITDKLSNLVAGQKVMAEIQSLLPNGTYRAMINQRNITLALPFSAKAGDSLELLVTESDGKLALAVLSKPDGSAGTVSRDSASATLSRTGQLISNLFSGAREAKGGPVSLPLNGNQPIASAPPGSAQDILPLLKQAITQSGMFYESHQAEWIEGRFSKSALLQEPQGKLSSPLAFAAANAEQTSAALLSKTASTAIAGESVAKSALLPNRETVSTARLTADAADAEQASAVLQPKAAGSTIAGELASTTRLNAETIVTDASSGKASTTQPPGQLVAPQTQPIVQQQLEALATQTFTWQGQVWPGQEMRWEIDEDASRHGQGDEETAEKWATRLHLTLPNLGEVDARIRIEGNQITLAMTTDSAETRARMRASSVALRSQFDEAGLTLASMGFEVTTENTADGQTGA